MEAIRRRGIHFVDSVLKISVLMQENALNTEGQRPQVCGKIDNAEIYAALVAACAAAGSSQRTDTSFETPGSCIVTP
jgi:hypothetical protein